MKSRIVRISGAGLVNRRAAINTDNDEIESVVSEVERLCVDVMMPYLDTWVRNFGLWTVVMPASGGADCVHRDAICKLDIVMTQLRRDRSVQRVHRRGVHMVEAYDYCLVMYWHMKRILCRLKRDEMITCLSSRCHLVGNSLLMERVSQFVDAMECMLELRPALRMVTSIVPDGASYMEGLCEESCAYKCRIVTEYKAYQEHQRRQERSADETSTSCKVPPLLHTTEVLRTDTDDAQRWSSGSDSEWFDEDDHESDGGVCDSSYHPPRVRGVPRVSSPVRVLSASEERRHPPLAEIDGPMTPLPLGMPPCSPVSGGLDPTCSMDGQAYSDMSNIEDYLTTGKRRTSPSPNGAEKRRLTSQPPVLAPVGE